MALAACALVALGAPGTATAADTLVAPDPAADQLTALDGTVVWVSGKYGDQVLMQHTTEGGSARVQGAPRAPFYGTVDLGHDAHNKLVLTYMRCTTGDRCSFLRDDLAGRRVSFKHLALTRCRPTTAPAVWGPRAAWGLQCRKPNKQLDDKRSGLYIRTGSAAPRRLPLPKDAVKFHVTNIDAVDLRGTQVAAVAADVFSYAFTMRVTGTGIRSIMAGASEGDSDEHARGLALGAGATLWTLTDAEHAGDPSEALLFKVGTTCRALERLVNPPGPDQGTGFRATDLAVDGSTLYLLAPGIGIVTHDYTPEGDCTPL